MSSGLLLTSAGVMNCPWRCGQGFSSLTSDVQIVFASAFSRKVTLRQATSIESSRRVMCQSRFVLICMYMPESAYRPSMCSRSDKQTSQDAPVRVKFWFPRRNPSNPFKTRDPVPSYDPLCVSLLVMLAVATAPAPCPQDVPPDVYVHQRPIPATQELHAQTSSELWVKFLFSKSAMATI